MKDIYDGQAQKTKKLENELHAYRELISHLPLSFCYKDYKRGLFIQKTSTQSDTNIISLKKENSPSTLTTNFQVKQETPFEDIEKFLAPIIDILQDHIMLIDVQGVVTLCNQGAADDLKLERDSIIGKHISEILHLPNKFNILLETLETGTPIINRVVLDSNFGIYNTRIYYNENKKIKRIVVTYRSHNNIKETEKQSLTGRIATGIAHEIRNPLTTVRGYLQFLSDSLTPDISNLITSLLIPEIDRANKIITDFLSICKPSDSEFVLVGTNSYIRKDLGPFLKSEALLHNVNLQFDCSQEVDNCYISIHPSEILQVFIHLFRNSLEAKNNKRLRLTISTKLYEQRVQVTFKDNGLGIGIYDLAHIFDPFYTTKDDGTGLGLSISRKIIENHGGTISIHSSSIGTVVTIQLPYITQT